MGPQETQRTTPGDSIWKPSDDEDDDAGVSTMICVDGRRAEEGRAPAPEVVRRRQRGEGRGGCRGETTSPRLLKRSYLRALKNIRSLATTPGHSDPAEIAGIDLIWNPAEQRRSAVWLRGRETPFLSSARLRLGNHEIEREIGN